MNFDMRWLQLSFLVMLRCLEISDVVPQRDELAQLVALKRLERLSLVSLNIADKDIEYFLPCLPQLQFLSLRYCQNLTHRILKCLPAQLEVLDVYSSHVLEVPLDFELRSEFFCSSDITSQDGTKRSVETVSADGVIRLRFEFFFFFYAGESFTKLVLRESEIRDLGDFAYMLLSAPKLLRLDLEFAKGLTDIDIGAISKLPKLRELVAGDTANPYYCLSVLASGFCRKSLRFIDLRCIRNIGDITSAHRCLFTNSFDASTVILWTRGDAAVL